MKENVENDEQVTIEIPEDDLGIGFEINISKDCLKDSIIKQLAGKNKINFKDIVE